MRNEIYLKNNQKMQASSRFSADISSSYSSTTLNTQLSTDSTQQIPNIYHHNSLVDTLSAGSVVSYTSAYLTQNTNECIDLPESSLPPPRSGIYVGTTIVEELNEDILNADEEDDIEKKKDISCDDNDKKMLEIKISNSSSSAVSEAEECIEQHSDKDSIEKKDQNNDTHIVIKRE